MACRFLRLCVWFGVLNFFAVAPKNALGAPSGDFAPPESGMTGPQTLLVQIFINGLPQGLFSATQTAHGINLSFETLQQLKLPWSSLIVPAPTKGVTGQYDVQTGTLHLQIPVADLQEQTLNAYAQNEPPPLLLSPEAVGGWVTYNLNVRHVFGTSSTRPLFSRGNNSDALGGVAQFVSTGPDFLGNAGFAYDSSVDAAPIRLDDSLTWRPQALAFAASVGDGVSSVTSVTAAARSWRFGGIAMGTDHSAMPGWSQSALPSILGSAQADSAVDLYVNGVRAYQTRIAGGKFNLVLPAGASGQSSRVVITDASGRTQIINLQAPLVYADTIRPGLFLWSVGAGAPRFNYATQQTSYENQVYGYATGRYGLSNRTTAEGHLEAGPGLVESELGLNGILGRRVAYQALLGASQAGTQRGGAVSGGVSLALPGQLTLDETAGYNLPGFRDVVAVSGRAYDLRQGYTHLAQNLPYRSQISTRLSWQLPARLSLSLSWQQFSYPQEAHIGFESASLGWSNRVAPAFLTVSEDNGNGQSGFSVLAGVSISFGRRSLAASSGFASHAEMLDVSAASSLPQSGNGLGWQVNASQEQQTRFVDARVEARTSAFIPGLELQNSSSTNTGVVSLSGVAGVIGLHPFVSASNQSGMMIADVGVPGVSVIANGEPAGRTGWMGTVAVPVAGDGVAETVAIDTSKMPFDDIAGTTSMTAALRQDSATILHFNVKTASFGAVIVVTVNGKPPPLGSTLVGQESQAPIDNHGRAYLPSMRKHELLSVLLPNGQTCHVQTNFNGQGGMGLVLGPLPCVGEAK